MSSARRNCIAAILAGALGWAHSAGAAPPGWKEGKSRVSVNGAWAIRLLMDPQNNCAVEASKDSGVAWSIPKCLGTLDDFFFINNDGDRFWVIHALPEIPRRQKGERKPPQLRAVVAEEFDKDGKRLAAHRLGDYLQAYRIALVRSLQQHFKWLEGVYDVPGKGPRLKDDQTIEFETVASKTHKLSF